MKHPVAVGANKSKVVEGRVLACELVSLTKGSSVVAFNELFSVSAIPLREIKSAYLAFEFSTYCPHGLLLCAGQPRIPLPSFVCS